MIIPAIMADLQTVSEVEVACNMRVLKSLIRLLCWKAKYSVHLTDVARAGEQKKNSKKITQILGLILLLKGFPEE